MSVKTTHQRAVDLFNKRDFARALTLFESLPQTAAVRHNIAMCYRDIGGLENLEKARDILGSLVKCRVKDGTLYNQIKEGFVSIMTMIVRHYAQIYRLDEALKVNLESMKVMPNHPILLYNQGHLYKCLGQHEAAITFLNRSLIYNPTYFDAYIEKINIYNDARNYYKAEQVIREGLEAIPADPRFYNELGVCLCRLGKIKDGFDAYQMGLSLPSCDPVVTGKIYTNVGNAYSFLGDVPASLENSKRGYQSDPTNTTAMQNYLMNLLYVFQNPFMDTLKQHFEVGSMYAKQMAVKAYKVVPYSGPRNAKIRIGYVSGDFFGEHPMTYFLKALLTCYDKDKFEVYGYSNQKIGNVPAYSPDIQWRDIKYLDTNNVAYKITKEDKIDVLVDLSGHTACNRMDIFSNRCAKVQISYLGYPCITGVPDVDYYVIDGTFDMKIKTIAMPHCFTHYWPSSVPESGSLVSPYHTHTDGSGGRFFHLGTLNKLAKVNQAMVDMWDAILEHFPNTKLLIRRNYCFKFKNNDRVIMLEHEDTYQGHLKRYNMIDIALDTAPYSGTTTTCESLIMGTPVVTLADRKNKTIHQNVSASLLINSGLGNLVVENLEDYYRVIQGLMDEISADPEHKQKVQKQFLEGNVCNRDQYLHDYETLIEELHNK
jgi:protein O-GlcNAc transferase